MITVFQVITRLYAVLVQLIPASECLMGSDPGVDKDAWPVEQPQHTLHLPDYYLAKTPVTSAQYAAFMQATGYK